MYTKTVLAGFAAASLLTTLSLPTAQAGELPYSRLAGPTGVETSLAVAGHVYPGAWSTVYVASNANPVDALPAATIGNGSIVLTDNKTLSLGGKIPSKIVLLGRTGAVSSAIEQQANNLVGASNVSRLAGADRNATAREIAKEWVRVNGTPSVAYITKNAGSGPPDADES